MLTICEQGRCSVKARLKFCYYQAPLLIELLEVKFMKELHLAIILRTSAENKYDSRSRRVTCKPIKSLNWLLDRAQVLSLVGDSAIRALLAYLWIRVISNFSFPNRSQTTPKNWRKWSMLLNKNSLPHLEGLCGIKYCGIWNYYAN